MTVLEDSDYEVEITIGDHTFYITSEDSPIEDDINPLDDLRIGWDKPISDPYPQQPNPTSCRVAFFTRDAVNLSDVDITTPMQIKVTSGGTTIAGFTGRVSDLDAQARRLRSGDLAMFYDVIGVDYVADLGEISIDLVRPQESAEDRLLAIAALIEAAGGPLFHFPSMYGGWDFVEISAYRTNALAAMLDHLRQLPRIVSFDAYGGRQLLCPRTTAGVLDEMYVGWQARAYVLTWPPLALDVVDGLLTIVTDAPPPDTDVPTGVQYRPGVPYGIPQVPGGPQYSYPGTTVGAGAVWSDDDDATYVEFGQKDVGPDYDVCQERADFAPITPGRYRLRVRCEALTADADPGLLFIDQALTDFDLFFGFGYTLPVGAPGWIVTEPFEVSPITAADPLFLINNFSVADGDPSIIDLNVYEVILEELVPRVPVGWVIHAAEVAMDDVKWSRNKFTSTDQVNVNGPSYTASVTRQRSVTREKV